MNLTARVQNCSFTIWTTTKLNEPLVFLTQRALLLLHPGIDQDCAKQSNIFNQIRLLNGENFKLAAKEFGATRFTRRILFHKTLAQNA